MQEQDIAEIQREHEIERLTEQLARSEEKADALAALQMSINSRIHELWRAWAKASDARFDADETMEGIQDRMQRLGREIYYAQQQVAKGNPDPAALRLLKAQIEDLDRMHSLHEQNLDEGTEELLELGLTQRRHVENKQRVREDRRRQEEDARREAEDESDFPTGMS